MIRQRQPRIKSDAHLQFIRSLPCCACWRTHGVQAAHLRMPSLTYDKRPSGVGEKPDDRWTLPLCPRCHLNGPNAQHRIGEEAFWQRVGIDPHALALALFEVSGNYEAGERAIIRAMGKEP